MLGSNFRPNENKEISSLETKRIIAEEVKLKQRMEWAVSHDAVERHGPVEDPPQVSLHMVHHRPARFGTKLRRWRWVVEQRLHKINETGAGPKGGPDSGEERGRLLDPLSDSCDGRAKGRTPGMILEPAVSPELRIVPTLRRTIEDLERTSEPGSVGDIRGGHIKAECLELREVFADERGCPGLGRVIRMNGEPLEPFDRAEQTLKGLSSRPIDRSFEGGG